jgi:hypothetical protein
VNHQPNPLPILQAENIVISLNHNFNTIIIMGLYYNGNKIAQPYINGVKYNAYYNGQKLWNNTPVEPVKRFVMFAYGSKTGAYSDNNGTTWKTMTITNNQSSEPGYLAFGAGKFVSLGSGYNAHYSSNGVIWTKLSLTTDIILNRYGLKFENGKFVAATTNGIYSSTNGINWTQHTTPNTYLLCYGNNKWLRSDYFGLQQVSFSTNLTSWSSVTNTGISNVWINSIAYGNGKYVAGGYNQYTGSLWYSSDGITWTNVTSMSNYNFWKVIYANGLFIASCSDGLAYSSNGISWTVVFSNNIMDIAYGNGNILAPVYNSNYGYKSTSGNSWTGFSGMPAQNWNAIAYGQLT